jgi:glycosyltransferase involved in cell wall biosynthesis
VRLTLVVPATDDPPTLHRCLEAVRAATDPPDEVVVVRTPRHAGPAAARNAGAGEATGDVLVFVDSDVLVHTDAFSRIRAAFARDPRLAAVFGSYDDRVVDAGVVAGFRNLLHHVVHQRSAGDARTFWAGLGAIRRDAFADIGGFDAVRYPHASIEDVELGGRLAGRGPIVLDPALQGTHLKRWTLRSMVVTDFARRGVPWVTLMTERREIPSTLNLGARERASAVATLAAVAALLGRRPYVASAAVATGMMLNADLYRAVGRRLGMRGVLAAVPLHAIHQLVGVAAVAAALVRRRAR